MSGRNPQGHCGSRPDHQYDWLVMKKFLIPLLTILSVSVFAQSDNEATSVQSDFDGDGFIGSPDLWWIPSAYGEAFQPNGVLPVGFGGTGVTSLDSLKLDLGLVFLDVISLGNGNSSGLVQGDIIISGTLSQGDGCVASGAYANASGRFSTASGFYVMQQTRTVLLLVYVHQLKVKAQQRFLLLLTQKEDFKQLLKVLDRTLKDISRDKRKLCSR